MKRIFHFGGLISSRSLLGTQEALLGEGSYRGKEGIFLTPLKYLFWFKISTNDSGTQRKFLSNMMINQRDNLVMFFFKNY